MEGMTLSRVWYVAPTLLSVPFYRTVLGRSSWTLLYQLTCPALHPCINVCAFFKSPVGPPYRCPHWCLPVCSTFLTIHWSQLVLLVTNKRFQAFAMAPFVRHPHCIRLARHFGRLSSTKHFQNFSNVSDFGSDTAGCATQTSWPTVSLGTRDDGSYAPLRHQPTGNDSTLGRHPVFTEMLRVRRLPWLGRWRAGLVLLCSGARVWPECAASLHSSDQQRVLPGHRNPVWQDRMDLLFRDGGRSDTLIDFVIPDYIPVAPRLRSGWLPTSLPIRPTQNEAAEAAFHKWDAVQSFSLVALAFLLKRFSFNGASIIGHDCINSASFLENRRIAAYKNPFYFCKVTKGTFIWYHKSFNIHRRPNGPSLP